MDDYRAADYYPLIPVKSGITAQQSHLCALRAIASNSFLPASYPRSPCGLRAPAVYGRRAGVGVSPVRPADFGAKGVVEAFQRSVGLPRSEVDIDGLPRRQVVREHAPGASGAHGADEGVDDFAQVGLAWSAAPFGRRKHGAEYAPLGVCEVGVIRLAVGGGGSLVFHVSSAPPCSSFIKHP